MTTFTVRDGNAASQAMEAMQFESGAFSLVHNARPFYLAVAMGLIDGHRNIGKFGYNPLIAAATDPEDVWENGGTYTYDATAAVVSVGSTSGADTMAIRITGLDALGYEVSQVVTLTGTTRVALPTPLWRVFRMANVSGTDITGNVTCYTGTGAPPALGAANVRAAILNGNNQTQMSHYTIPRGYVAFIVQGEAGIVYNTGGQTGTEFGRLSYRVRTYTSVFRIQKTISLLNSGSSIYGINTVPGPIPALTDIKVVVDQVSEDIGVWSTYELILIDETCFPQATLQGFGQPGSGGGNAPYPT